MRTANILLSLAIMACGVATLFLAWRGRGWPGARRRSTVAGGWVLAVLSLVLWARAVSPDVGASQAVAAAMLLALVGVGAHSLSLPAARKPPRETPTAASVAPPTSWPAVAHGGARLVGSLAAAPAFAVLLGLQAARWGPGDAATRLVEAVFVVVLAAVGGLVFMLASPRPLRAAGGLCAGTAVLALLVALSRGES
jgi:hypothetical protein